MKDLSRMFVGTLLIPLVAGCAGMPKDRVEAVLATKIAIPANREACPPIINPDAVKKAYPERDRQVRPKWTVDKLIACPQMRGLIAWALSAPRYEGEPSECTSGYSSLSCRSERGPQGASQRGGVKWNHRGSSYAELLGASNSLSYCPSAAMERREVHFSIDQEGKWWFSTLHICYW